MKAHISLDLTGLECPLPAIHAKRQLRSMAPGEILHLVCTDPLAAIDIPFVAEQLGHELADHRSDENRLHFWLRVTGHGRTINDTSWPAVDLS